MINKFSLKDNCVCNDEKPLQNLVEGYSFTSIFRTIAFIGDSLSSGEFEVRHSDGSSTYHDMYEYSWGQFIARKNGIKAYNFSRGGMTAKWYMESFAQEEGFFSKELACQAYVIALAENDLVCQNMELGSINDINPDDYYKNKKTFAGYYAQIISRYKEISPDAKFFLVSLPNVMRSNGFRGKAEGVLSLLKDFEGHFDNTYVIDLYNHGICYDDVFRKTYYYNGHLNPMGYVYTAKIIDSYIDYIIRHNPDDFKEVGFINSGIEYKK